ncbi:fungal-specific transcription factor domain-containing protein [Lipomyces kononenkoae]|uniref:Fungal-specific transcription factor domain-containing protein n=1 Tax=Lipomyces kononenkoae TaxID=34357 RepID=A0ACC3T183_LIPKO
MIPSEVSSTDSPAVGVAATDALCSADFASRPPELVEDEDDGFDIDENDIEPEDDDDESDSPIKGGTLKNETSPADAGKQPAGNRVNPTPIQKRRRVTRACDECRRKKIKCDGKQPCTHCTVYSYECTYDQPSNRRRNPAPLYIHQLESRLQLSNAVIQALIPGVDIFKAGFDVPRFLGQLKANANSTLTKTATAALQAANAQVAQSGTATANARLNDTAEDSGSLAKTNDKDNNIESMVVSLGRLDVDETGHLDYVGHSSGRSFVQHMRAHFLNDHPDSIPVDIPKMASFSYSPSSNGLIDDSPSDYYNYQQMAEFRIILPTKEVAWQLINAVWDQACVVIRFGHRPTMQRRLDELYSTDPDDYTPDQINFLPLVYCYLAVGVLFTQDMRDAERKDVDEGYRYFVAARKMIDITEARDTDAIQTVILMIMFLLSTARLSTCYSYIGIALRAALRLGLHRKVAYSFSPVESEVRKRVFWTIRKMDIHVSAMLGLPRCIDENDIDQEQPLEIDDEYITETGILPHPVGVITHQFVANVHTRLMSILSHIVEDVYPIKPRTPVAQAGQSATNLVSYIKVVELENDLQHWLDSLPFELRPGIDPPEKWYTANRLINMAFCYVKIILYRPFIHYVGQKYKHKMTDERPYACAANCISTARTVVHLADELVQRDVLRSAHLFSVYTIFFSTAVLIYYVHEDPYNPHVHEFRKEAEVGKNVINRLKNKSAAAARTYVMLSGLFELLNKRMATMKKPDGATPDDSKRKRRSDSRQTHQTTTTTEPAKSGNSQRLTKSSSGIPHPYAPQPQSRQFAYNDSNIHANNDVNVPLHNGRPPASVFPVGGEVSSTGGFVPPQAPSYDAEFLTGTEASGGYTDTALSSPTPISQSVMPGMDPSDLASSTKSLNGSPMLYFPSIGTSSSSSANQRAESNNYFSQLVNNADNSGLGPYYPNADLSSAPMMAYSAGPMDKLEAQLFGRFLPPYMYQPNVQPQSSQTTTVESAAAGGVKSRPGYDVVDMGGVPFLPDNAVDESGIGFGTPLSSESGGGMDLPAGYVQHQLQQGPPQPPASASGWVGNVNVMSDQARIKPRPATAQQQPRADTDGVLTADTGFLGAIPDDWNEFLSQHSELSGLKNLMMQ